MSVTNYDRLFSKTPEELAEFLGDVAGNGGGSCAPGHYDCTNRENCAECWLDWLNSPAKEERKCTS